MLIPRGNIGGTSRQKKVIFHGNSLSNFGNALVIAQESFPRQCYASILALNRGWGYYNAYSSGGRRTYEMTAAFDTEVGQNCRARDILIFWEICNDAHDKITDTTGAAIYQDVLDYFAAAAPYNLVKVCLTGIPRNYPSLDDATITDRIFACNALMRANSSPPWDLLIDVAALSQFDASADTTNTTYYNNLDQTHLTTAGYALIATTVYNAINNAGLLT